ncbi:hypothetical protein BHE74_00051018 [Ensete ventricosum]|uniref:Uncharacterized protein n=1 Tax=Ensete ventricosum TaxID=4639 RepID=A0A445MMB6_ENSVE|nr:hypothetical protein BHE74_00051018 [Ensete ventricosum]RZR75380.1 hypothetical protein BHM03_00056058 [Ensete ventricosum]
MRHRGQAASTIDVASGLVWHGSPCSVSDERHEEDDDDPRGESTTMAALLDVSSLIGGARFSFRSTLWLFPWLLRRLILVPCKQPYNSSSVG